jgi:decaprenylphospho-beta-D-erythro-pentofuranosid-2-ulose 2-reductase
MQNALHEPQTMVLFGGTSEIGRAIVDELLSPSAQTLVLACRRPDEAQPERFERDGLTVVVEQFDAADTEHHEGFVQQLVAEHGDVDVAIIAFGVLGSQSEFDDDPHAAA